MRMSTAVAAGALALALLGAACANDDGGNAGSGGATGGAVTGRTGSSGGGAYGGGHSHSHGHSDPHDQSPGRRLLLRGRLR